VFHLRNTNDAGKADIAFAFGPKNTIPIAGDWDDDGIDTVGIYDLSSGTFFLKNTHSGGPADERLRLGLPGDGWVPLAGNWEQNTKQPVTTSPPATPPVTPTRTPTATPSGPEGIETPTATTQPMIRHTVALGEVLSAIAARYGVTVEAIVAANGLEDPNRLEVGQVLLIPQPATSTP